MFVIRSGRHPHEVYLLAVFGFYGVAGLLVPGRTTNAVLKVMPTWGLYVFYGVLAVGSLLALIGIFGRGRSSFVVELFGLSILTVELIGYGVAVYGFAGPRGLLSALIPIGFGIANVARIKEIARELRREEVAPPHRVGES